MKVAKVCNDGCQDNRPAIWIDAGLSNQKSKFDHKHQCGIVLGAFFNSRDHYYFCCCG